MDEKDVLEHYDLDFSDHEGYVVVFEDSSGLRRIVTRICNSFMNDLYETSPRSITQDMREARSQKRQIKDLIGESRGQFVNYLNDYSPLKDADDVSLVKVY